MKKFILFFFLLNFVFYNSAIANNSIVFVDIDFLIQNSTIGKTVLKKLENKDKENLQFLKDREQIIRKSENELKKKQNIISEEEFNKELNLLKSQVANLKLEKDKMVKNFTEFKNKELSSVIKSINEVIQNYMKNNSVDVVLDKKNIYIGKNSSDITSVILKNIENK
tara:strand:- start:113 stop:613 length:501 start_codon:yes stop_codon:yes gene_type:complete